MGSARFFPHHRILFLYLDEEVDLINELFLATFSLRTKKAAHPSAGNGDQLQVGLLPVLPVSQGLTWPGKTNWVPVLGSSSQLGEEVMSGSLGVELLGETFRKLQAIHIPQV